MMMKAQKVHALRACSLVAIPPSEERMPPPGGFPGPLRDELNKLGWPHSGCGPGHGGSTS